MSRESKVNSQRSRVGVSGRFPADDKSDGLLGMKFELDIDRRNIADDALLRDVAAVAVRLGTTSPTAEQYEQHGQFHPSD